MNLLVDSNGVWYVDPADGERMVFDTSCGAWELEESAQGGLVVKRDDEVFFRTECGSVDEKDRRAVAPLVLEALKASPRFRGMTNEHLPDSPGSNDCLWDMGDGRTGYITVTVADCSAFVEED